MAKKKRKTVREKYLEQEISHYLKLMKDRAERITSLETTLTSERERLRFLEDTLHEREKQMDEMINRSRVEVGIYDDIIRRLLDRYSIRDPRVKTWRNGDAEIHIKTSFAPDSKVD